MQFLRGGAERVEIRGMRIGRVGDAPVGDDVRARRLHAGRGQDQSALEGFTAGAQAHSLLTGVDALALPITGWLAATRARLGMPDEARATLTGFSTEREREGGAVAHELVALDAICNERAVICLMEGDPATALDVLRDLQDVTPPVDFPACAFVEAHLLAGIATWTWGIETRPLPQPSGVELSRDLGPRQICR